MTLAATLLVGFGSSIGALARYWVGRAITHVNNHTFPWGTWIVNVAGTLLLGIFSEFFTVLHHHPDWWLILGTGFCGGFTTFSTMSVEAVTLFRSQRILGIIYLGSSLALGLVLAWIAEWWF